MVVESILRRLDIFGDRRGNAGPCGIDRARGQPGYDFHYARRIAARGPPKPAGRNRPKRPEIQPFRHFGVPETEEGRVSAAGRRRGKEFRRRLKLPAFRYPVKRGVALEGADVARKQAESDRAAPVAVVDAVDERREFLAPIVVGRE